VFENLLINFTYVFTAPTTVLSAEKVNIDEKGISGNKKEK
jgi:hypothetical protein